MNSASDIVDADVTMMMVLLLHALLNRR